jgi:predicted secreted Zn-dependent protease
MLAAFVLLVAAAAYASTIRATITWTDVAGETGYRIGRAINNGGPGNVYAAIGTVAADVTTFADNAQADWQRRFDSRKSFERQR